MWGYVAFAVVGALLAIAFTRTKPPGQKPAGLNELELPTAEDGREIPVLFGCRKVKGPNVVWYGDLKTERIKSKSGKK